MSKEIQVTGSYIQDQRHAKVSEKFNVIQASSVGEAMANHGLSLVSLSTGRARHEDKANFQRTLSRYRGPEIADGIFLDIVYDSKHMGRGVDKILVGIYRVVCTNGLISGETFFNHEIRHNGQTYENLNTGIAAALDMQIKLADMIKRMQGIVLTVEQRKALALDAVKLLTPETALNVRYGGLLKVNRESDALADLWTTYNLIQENAVKGNSIAYQLHTVDESLVSGNRLYMRNMTVRPIKPNTTKDLNFNQGFFDVAAKLAA